LAAPYRGPIIPRGTAGTTVVCRSAVAHKRLRLLADGRGRAHAHDRVADGTRQLVFEPLTLLEKLAGAGASAAAFAVCPCGPNVPTCGAIAICGSVG
jgi:hypothetical protein